MTIEFETPKPILQTQFVLKTVAEEMMRSKSRYFDEHEHEIPWDYIEFMHTAMKAMGVGSLAPKEKSNGHDGEEGKEKASAHCLSDARDSRWRCSRGATRACT